MVKPHLFWSPEMVEASPNCRRFLKVSLEGDGGMLAFSSLYKIVVYITLFNRPRLSAEMSVISNLFHYVFSTASHSNSTPQSRLSSSLGFSSSENVLLFPWNWWIGRVEHAHLPWKISLSPVHHGSKDSNFVRTLPWGGLCGWWVILSCSHLNRNHFAGFLENKRYPGQVLIWARDYSQPGMLPSFNGGSLLLGDKRE